MASSSIGISELSYGEVPYDLIAGGLHSELTPADRSFGRQILLVSGLKTNNDVMRGEETMLTGLDFGNENVAVIFPGTHCKHVYVKNNIVIDFKTYMSGEFFDLLAHKSVLAKSVVAESSTALLANGLVGK